MKRIALGIFAAGALALGGCVSTKASTSETAHSAAVAPAPANDSLAGIRGEIGRRFDDPRFGNAHCGVLIQSMKTGEVWYERNADRLFNPASNEKIPTTATALLELGPDFKFETTLTHSGQLKDGVVQGDLIVFGNGDPTLYTRFHKDTRDVFREWAKAMKEKGITRVSGDVIGDDNAFDDDSIGNGWPLDGLDAWYSAEVGALQLNENYVDLTVTPPSTVDGQAKIEPNVPSSYFTIVNKVRVRAEGGNSVNASRAHGTNTIVVSGTVAAGGKSTEVSPTITNTTLFYATVLKETLEAEGIAVGGAAKDCDDIAGWKHTAADFATIATHQSPPLSEVAKGLMKRSQNMYAETMPRAISWKKDGVGTFRGGRKLVEKRLAEFGVEPGTYAYSDGSGLSRYNYVAPRQLVKILTGMRKTDVGQVWLDTMPIAGVDGTLAKRMKGTKAEGNVRAKTGTISNVRGLSGYVTTADGEELVFSFLVNGHLRSSEETEQVTDGVLAEIAAFSRKGAQPTAAGN